METEEILLVITGITSVLSLLVSVLTHVKHSECEGDCRKSSCIMNTDIENQ